MIMIMAGIFPIGNRITGMIDIVEVADQVPNISKRVSINSLIYCLEFTSQDAKARR
jgi:hypothetical protein